MKKFLCALVLAAMLMPAGYALYSRYGKERVVVILSTNDIHANLSNFPRLATAVKLCRDTVDCILADAGDRWTGNAFVDLAPEPRKPIIDLMNELGYDVATFGNHEFDGGRDFLRDMLGNCRFRIVCGNIRSTDGRFPDIEPYTVIRADGLRIGFAGLVTNFQNNHPEGNDASFEGLEFPDAFETADRMLEQMRPHCDVAVLLSHLGTKFDSVLLNRTTGYDMMISGHSHLMLDGEVNGTRIGQTRKALTAIGVTTIRARGRKVTELDYRNIMLEEYQPDSTFQSRVEVIMSDPHLNEIVGSNAAPLDKTGLADMHTSLIRQATDADAAFYHLGGIRLSELPAGDVSRATLIESDIFISHVYTIVMTPAQMRRMIITKYNDAANANESHRIDLLSTVPYTIVTDSDDTAVDVVFPTLDEGRKYKTAICSYVVENYKDIEGEQKTYYPDMTVPDIFIDYFQHHSPVHFSNEPKQQVVKRNK